MFVSLPKVVRSSLGLAVWLIFVGALISPVLAGTNQSGRQTGSSSVDGSYARLQGHAFHPSSGQCVLYSTLSADFTTLRQIQSGIVRCDGGPLGGSCPSGQVFVERYNGASYFCTPGYSFSNSYQYDATTFRNGPSSTTFTGQINGASLSQGGFGLSDEIRGLAWGEVAGTSTCPSSNSGSFFTWQKYDTSSGWSYVTGSDVHQYATFGFAGAPCWGTITSTSSQGAFDVDD
jgi:hypothetical protein